MGDIQSEKDISIFEVEEDEYLGYIFNNYAIEMAGKIASSFSLRMKMKGKFKDIKEHEE